MELAKFDELLRRRLRLTESVLASKSTEYSSEGDRLHNFKVACYLNSDPCTVEEAIWGMMKKHIVSMMDMVEGTREGKTYSISMVDEKLGDVINYTILLEAAFRERIALPMYRDTREVDNAPVPRDECPFSTTLA